MSLPEEITTALKQAIKAQDKRRMATLRLISAAIKDREIALRGSSEAGPVGDDQVLEILAKMVRQREESIKIYEEAGRLELATQEAQEITIVREFMPQQMDAEQTETACQALVAELGATGMKDMGACMSALKERFAGQMDFAKASAVIRGLLG
ncbi:MAG: GatB/YqeY domain-containing protein [Alphaproteobacteria bacterium]